MGKIGLLEPLKKAAKAARVARYLLASANSKRSIDRQKSQDIEKNV